MRQYYVEDDHPAIIKPERFDLVQRELEHRLSGKGRYSGVDKFSAKLRCGQCGSSYGPKVWHSNSKYRRVVYQCNGKFKHGCSTPHVDEQQIKVLFVQAVNELLSEKDEVIANLRFVQDTLSNTAELEKERQELCSELESLVGLVESCVAENTRVAQNQDEYQRRYDNLVSRYEATKGHLEAVQKDIAAQAARDNAIQYFIETLEQQSGIITEFDEALWGALLDYGEIFENGKMRFFFKNGIIL